MFLPGDVLVPKYAKTPWGYFQDIKPSSDPSKKAEGGSRNAEWENKSGGGRTPTGR